MVHCLSIFNNCIFIHSSFSIEMVTRRYGNLFTIFSILLSIIAVKKIIIAPKCYIYEIIAYSFILSLPALFRIDQLPIVASNILLISLLGKKRIAVKISIIIIFLILVWLIFTFFYAGSLLPDSAIAKSSGVLNIGWLLSF